jgi:hypothetical protein
VKPTEAFNVDLQWFSDPAAAEAAAATEAASTEVVKGDPVYFSNLSPALRPQVREALRPLQQPNDLAKAYVDMKKKMDRALIVPRADSPDPEEVKAFRAALDIPEGAAGYKIATDAFKDVQGVEEVVKMVQARAAAAHMSNAQGQGMFETIMGLSKAGRDAATTAVAQAKADFEPALLRSLGGDQKKADAAVNLMKSFLIKQIGSQRLVDKLTRDGYIYDPEFVLKAAGLEELLGEEPFIKGGGAGKVGRRAPKGTQGHYSNQFQDQFGANVKET